MLGRWARRVCVEALGVSVTRSAMDGVREVRSRARTEVLLLGELVRARGSSTDFVSSTLFGGCRRRCMAVSATFSRTGRILRASCVPGCLRSRRLG